MEPIPMGAFPFGEWDPLSVLFTGEDLDLTQGVIGHCPPGENQMYDTMSLVIPEDYFSASPEEHPAANQTVPGIWESFLDHTVSADCNPPMGSSQESGGFCGYYTPMLESMEERHCSGTFLPDFAGIQGGEGLCGDVRADPADHEASLPSLKKVQPKRKSTNLNSCSGEEDDAETGAPQNSKKRKPRASKDKGKRNVQPRKKQRLAKPNRDEGEGGNVIARQEGQSSSTYSSEEDDVPQELDNGESAQNLNEAPAMNSDGKTTRASRGAATDPQSLYARRRRERINERLRILQNLVPNGTKVDISTMLEEAVHYVKFLQLQIKLLSSDELWMYAPIAYNGMDIGLNQIPPPQLL